VKPWTLAACGIALVLFTLAVSAEVYDLTSPAFLPWHVALRKGYSVVAFSVLGYAVRRAFAEHRMRRAPLLTIVGLTAFSAMIELAQAAGGVREGLAWNALDVACGALGGSVGAALFEITSARH